MAGNNGQGGGLQQVHETLHASHALDPNAEADHGGDQSVPVGAIRVEEGRRTNDDGTATEQRAWKVYQFRDLEASDREMFTAKRDDAGFKVGDLTLQRKWYLVSQHDDEQSALAAAGKL